MNRACLVLSIGMTVFALGCQSGQPLFNGRDLAGWQEVGSTGAWSVKTDAANPGGKAESYLCCNGEKAGYAWLSTDRTYKDFVLELDWRIPADTNAGIFLRAPDRNSRISMTGMEVQIKDDAADQDLTDVSGSVFRRIPASGKYARPIGEWNHYRVTCQGRRLRIELNGMLVSDTIIDTVKPQGDDPPMSAVPDEGYIGLQNHGTPVDIRNVRIRELK